MGGSVPIIMPSLPLSFASLKIEMRERERGRWVQRKSFAEDSYEGFHDAT